MSCILTDFTHLFSSTKCLFYFAICLSSLFIWKYLKSYKNLPPGPIGFPIIGYYPFLKKKSHIHLNELAQKYGDVFSFYLGNKLVLVLNSYEAIKEAFIKQGENFAGRPRQEVLAENEIPSIFMSEGEIWKDYRRFTLKTLKDFGIGKLRMEPRIKEEIECLLEVLESYDGKPTDIGDLLRMSVSNVICSVKFGHRFNYSDKTFQYLMSVLGEHLKRSHPFDYFIYIPKLLKIPGINWLLGHKYLRETRDLLVEDIRNRIHEYIKTYKPGREDDFISSWLTEAERKGPKEGKHFTNEHLVQVSRSLFIAGTDTTANTLRWAILYLMEFTAIQTRVQQEIDNVVGHERLPSMTDREQMPFTEATLLEILRISSLTPLSIIHSNIKSTTLKGYTIPKRCVVVPNLWAVHFDPITYPEPEKFRPERFLDNEGKVIRPEKLIPFSLECENRSVDTSGKCDITDCDHHRMEKVGSHFKVAVCSSELELRFDYYLRKRQCLGEALAKIELFLYFVSMFQRFSFHKPKDANLSFDYEMGTTLCPNPFTTIAIRRNVN